MGAARLPSEEGRIEFKAYDAFTDLTLLEVCCHLVAGVCLAEDLVGQADAPDKALHQLAATRGFAEPRIAHGAALVLARAGRALVRHALLYASRTLVLGRGGRYALGTPAEVITAPYLRETYGVEAAILDLDQPPGPARRFCVPLVAEA